MQSSAWLTQATDLLAQHNIPTARLDALVLLEDITKRERGWLLAHPEHELSSDKLDVLEKLLTRRATHEPLAYIRGKTEFYGRTFLVTPDVLEPRPESETMIEILKEICVQPEAIFDAFGGPAETQKTSHVLRIADVGAGSGALGITAALEVPDVQVDLIEIDAAACKVAKTNVDLFTLNISTVQSDLLTCAPHKYDILLCNLPYVPDAHTINEAALHEPRLAIFGGRDGLDVYRKLFKQLDILTSRPLYILTEALPPQHAALAAIAATAGYKLAKTDDFIQAFRLAG